MKTTIALAFSIFLGAVSAWESVIVVSPDGSVDDFSGVANLQSGECVASSSLPAGFKTAKFAEVEIIETQDQTTCTAWENSDCTGASAVFASSTNFSFTSLGAVAGNVGAYQC